MRARSTLPLICLLMASTAWAAAPAGTFVFRLSGPEVNGTMTLSTLRGSVRSDIEMSAGRVGAMKMSMLMKGDDAKTLYMLDDARRSYAELSPSKNQKADAKTYTAKKIGAETVGKWKTTHVRLTDEKGQVSDVWTTPQFDLGRSIFGFLGSGAPGDDGMMKAVESVGAKGFPVKMVVSDGQKVTIELVSFDAKAPDAARFEIPAGYEKKSVEAVASGALPPEVQKQMEEAMKNLTPEQRAQLEKMMRERQGK